MSKTRTKLRTIPTNPPPQHLQIPPIPPILSVLPFPLQHPNRPPHPVHRTVFPPCPNLSITSTPPFTRASSSTLPLRLPLPPPNRPIRRREIVQTPRGRGSRWELCRCAREVEEGCLEAVLLWGLGRWRGRSCGSCPGGFAAAGARKGDCECLGSLGFDGVVGGEVGGGVVAAERESSCLLRGHFFFSFLGLPACGNGWK